MDNVDLFWQAKLAARLHDPLEKSLILMRTVEGHEGGTSRALRERLGLTDQPPAVRDAVRRADHWASAADRAAFPNRNADGRYPPWQNVRFHERPVIIHPLTGAEYDLKTLADVEPESAKALALAHLERLVHGDDHRRTALAFWRFSPEIDAKEIQSLWALLPADTRVPDHTIFDHLDLTAALAGCFQQDPEGGPALLAVSLGPVQDFIAAARSTSDLWAGSHLLARLAWEAMKVICERLGPESIVFPRLRGVPQVDVWLREEAGIGRALFDDCPWTWTGTDANPLFAAALPNRFTALVPAALAASLAQEITAHVRQWTLERAGEAYRLLLEAATIDDAPGLPGYAQIEAQLAGFPEVHWSVVPWSLVDTESDGRVSPGTPGLAAAMAPFYASTPPGFLGSEAWKRVSGELPLEDGWFWRPNPGALYPAVQDLLERAHAAAKSVRPFAQTDQGGWRDSLTGEAEWLTTDRQQLGIPPGQRRGTLWARVAESRPAWARPGEHLGALGALKRLWPTLFGKELEPILGQRVPRFVVSTHTMALATSLARAVRDGKDVPRTLAEKVEESRPDWVALPRKLARTLRDHPDGDLLRGIPGWLDAAKESGEEADLRAADALMQRFLGHKPEAYYGLLLMDGDRMGAWLAADPQVVEKRQRQSFHPQIRAGLDGFSVDAAVRGYADSPRAANPAFHMAISEALNHFALSLAPAVVEEQFHGRVLYAGGDDLMAMVPVIDLLPAMASLRAVYSGIEPAAVGLDGADLTDIRRQGNGFVQYRGRLMRVMGERATASCGAVIAHHQAPLSAVLRQLRATERRAKEEGGRDAFSITVVKRSGGALCLAAKWGDALRALVTVQEFLAEPRVSRRAVYNTTEWLRDLPEPEGDGEMVARMLAYQFGRQAGGKTVSDHFKLPDLARRLVQSAVSQARHGERLAWLENFLSVAEFLARETRRPEGSSVVEKESAA